MYKHVGKRNKTSVADVKLLKLCWSLCEEKAFEKCKEAVQRQATLAYRHNSLRLCPRNNALDLVWSGVVTQPPQDELSKPHLDQNYQPLVFLSGFF